MESGSGAVINERRVEIRAENEGLDLIGRQPLRILTTLEGVDLPGLLAVVRLHVGEPLKGRLHASPPGARLQVDQVKLDDLVTEGDQQPTFAAQALDRLEPLRAPAGFDVPGDELVSGRGWRHLRLHGRSPAWRGYERATQHNDCSHSAIR
ncbi:MAG: hypothetical protein E6K49_04265 [Gammaproteobacteria bacterium]|nr:MAG: hypothetical protein E6K49_04265 [Gammaproteobacteria bacterium]